MDRMRNESVVTVVDVDYDNTDLKPAIMKKKGHIRMQSKPSIKDLVYDKVLRKNFAIMILCWITF